MPAQRLSCPGVNRLLELVGNCHLDVIPGIDTPEKVAKEIRRIMALPYTKRYLSEYSDVARARRECGRGLSKLDVKFAAINQLIGGYGVEGVETLNTEEWATYINVGEEYAPTLIHFRGVISFTGISTFLVTSRVKFR